jgi:deoxyribonuclease V
MKFPDLHSWDLTTAEARDLQLSLADQVDVRTKLERWTTVAAADVSYNKFDPRLHAAVVVMDVATGKVVERVGLAAEATFPYVPGLLSFREAPPVLEAFRRLTVVPDVVLCDGQGFAHPRRLGLACHLGLWLGIPTIGCAKSRLIGTFEEPGPRRSDRALLYDEEERIGVVLRTRDRVSPLYVSPGHLCDFDDAPTVVLACTTKYRLPDAARAAHLTVNDLRREAGADRST